MRSNCLLLIGFLLISLFMPVFSAEPCAAAVIPFNNITLEKNGMNWEYKEQIVDNDSTSFRRFVDTQTGNNDSFVNAWEILKAEKTFRDKMEETLKTEPDVKLNEKADPVKVKDFEFSIPKEALGKTEKSSEIINSANVTYIFEKELSQGIDIWLMGTPDSNLTISLPPGFDVKTTEGLDGKKLEFENNLTILKGNFDHRGNVTLWLLENESFKANLQDTKENNETGSSVKEAANKTLKAQGANKSRENSEFLKKFLALFT